LETIETVKRYKREGGSMEQIASKLRPFTPSPSQVVDIESRRQADSPLPHGDQEAGAQEAPVAGDGDGLTLTIEEFPFPALLVNHDFEIEWINRQAEESIFNIPVSRINELESRNLFRLFFTWEFNSHLKNWEKVVAYHLQFAKKRFPKESIKELYQGISESEIRFLENVYESEPHAPQPSIQSSPLNLVLKNGESKPYQVHTMFFREGVFIVYVPTDEIAHDVMEMFAQRGKIIDELLRHRMPSLVSLCVLVADLQDSVKISAELLPEEYFELINQLWKTMQHTFDRYDGIYGKQAGDGMLYYFIKKPGTNYIMNALNCALELKEKMKEFNSEWQVRKGWLNDLYINTGINEGQEFFGAVTSSAHLEFTALGDSINYAGRLSDFARHGAIWTTKNVISKMDQEDISRVRFGVYRKQHDREVFIENSFARVIDLLGEDERLSSKFFDIATLPIAEVVASTPTSTDQ